MSTLMCAPRSCGSWYWDLEDVFAPGLESALKIAEKMVEVLSRFDLLTPTRLEYNWYTPGSGGIGVGSRLLLTEPLGDPNLPGRVLGSRPVAFEGARASHLRVVGTGAWVDAQGMFRKESRLVEVSVAPDSIGAWAELAVYHDIWSWFDFSGRPHPEVYNRNAPRLADALREITSVFGVEPEPGEPTYFGHAVGFGISTPDADDDGLGPNLTDHL
ncbi:hypothetical protein [Streptomyces atratus]|uniref:hypothetical protein n=1 Tax=Streptomyces atratus TaxID=1893 RepID=UPI00225B187E|nr:hypothetical protein [Streptomyces atratus]MCX5341815.1 hypothetical protein [Streptomyces atratus]